MAATGPAGRGGLADREVDAAHLQDGRPQDVGGPALGLSGALGDDDRGGGPAAVDEDEGPAAGAELEGPRAPRARGAGGHRRAYSGERRDNRQDGSAGEHHPAL